MTSDPPSVLAFVPASEHVGPDRFDELDVEVRRSDAADSSGDPLDGCRYDAVLVECGPDPAEGVGLVETLGHHSPRVPVAVATGDAGDDAAELAFGAGADEVIRGRLDEVPPGLVTHRVRTAIARGGETQRCRFPVEDRGGLLDRALDDLDDVVYVVAEDGGLVAWNAALEERLGYSSEELAGITGAEIYPTDQWEESTGEGSGERKRPDSTPVLDLVASDGERLPHEFRSVWFDDPATGERYRVGIGRDASDWRRYERELRARNERLVEFTRSLVGTLRSSLEVAYAAVELARTDVEGSLDDVEGALDELDDLLGVAVELADLGRAVVEPSVVGLPTAAERAWSDVRSGSAGLELADDLGRVECDPARLRRLLAELLDNAVRHGPRQVGRVDGGGAEQAGTGGSDDQRVTVRVGRLDNGFYVADDGRGIPASERGLVFEPGYSTREGAEGVGLAVVEEIANAHGWSVSVGSDEADGARVEVRGVAFADG